MSIAKITQVANDLAQEMGMDEAAQRGLVRRMLWWFRHRFKGQYVYVGEREPFVMNDEAMKRAADLLAQGSSLRDTAAACDVSHESIRKNCQQVIVDS